MKTLFLILFLILFLPVSPSLALFDTGTALDKGKAELDFSVNPFSSISYGQSWVFFHYGLGGGYEVHGYQSKWGAITDWNNSVYESYLGLLKQWAHFDRVDLATAVGVRQVWQAGVDPTLIGPGILYTVRVTDQWRVAGHLQYIGDISGQTVSAYNLGYTSEIGLYYMFRPGWEIAGGIFTNS
ncbi:MAG TPA: hypothetical protein VMT55_06165, partial [Candidatus Sulfotelmatobacter sp.]|nr:hypothetical protein [Candidatus Sulfotelmatobacter sp.]